MELNDGVLRIDALVISTFQIARTFVDALFTRVYTAGERGK
jgi:hypothetical protein